MKAAVLGYGNIGSGVAQVLDENRELIAAKVGQPIEVKYVLDLRDIPGDPYESCMVKDIQVIVDDPEVEIVVEAMGGTSPAYEYVKAALLAGKHVATSNKALVAKHGTELLAIAAEKNLNFQFEASVGGGIPIIRPLNSCITADDIDEITGILNGTTNFMLTKMANEGCDYDSVLKEAQALGFAEADPTADVEGHDAGRKIAILCSLAFDKFVDFEDLKTEGITKITAEDMQYAESMGRVIKLFATGKKTPDGVFAMVSPVMAAKNHPLANINGVLNGVLVRGNVIGDLMFMGAGAGKLPTASAVVADMVEIARNMDRTVSRGWGDEKMALMDMSGNERDFFVRVAGKDCAAQVEELFGAVEYVELPGLEETAFVVKAVKEADMAAKAAKLPGFITRIRVEG